MSEQTSGYAHVEGTPITPLEDLTITTHPNDGEVEYIAKPDLPSRIVDGKLANNE